MLKGANQEVKLNNIFLRWSDIFLLEQQNAQGINMKFTIVENVTSTGYEEQVCNCIVDIELQTNSVELSKRLWLDDLVVTGHIRDFVQSVIYYGFVLFCVLSFIVLNHTHIVQYSLIGVFILAVTHYIFGLSGLNPWRYLLKAKNYWETPPVQRTLL